MKYFVHLALGSCFICCLAQETSFNSKTCRIPGVAVKAPQRLCELRNFLNTIENYDSKEKNNLLEKYPFTTNNFIICGKTGLGKSTAGKNITKDINAEFRYYHAQEILESHQLIREIYQEAEKTVAKTHRPVVIVIDNIELFAKAKNGVDLDISNSAKGVVTGFHYPLSTYEGNPYIITIFTSDVPFSDIFHTYQKRLLEGCVEWKYPDREDREKIIRHFFKKLGQDKSDCVIKLLAQITVGLTGKDIEMAIYNSNKNISDTEKLNPCFSIMRSSYPAKGLMVIMGVAALCAAARFGIKRIPQKDNPSLK